MSLNSAGLKSLKNLPKLQRILKLELNENKLQTGLDELLIYKTIETIKLQNNQITKLDELEKIGKHDTLSNLDLSGNPISELDNYREKVFEIMENLEILDS